MKMFALIPAYNEETTIADVLTRTRPYVDGMIVVDDGSSDRTAEIARTQGAVVVSHVINRGLGAAIGTGFAAAQSLGADVVVTLDADGQHDPAEIWSVGHRQPIRIPRVHQARALEDSDQDQSHGGILGIDCRSKTQRADPRRSSYSGNLYRIFALKGSKFLCGNQDPPKTCCPSTHPIAMSIIQMLIIVFALFAVTRTVLQFKKGAVSRHWLLFWILFWVGAGTVAVLPQTADTLARIVGVGRGADVVIYLSLIVIFYLIFRLYVKIEQVESEITRLVRKLAIDELDQKDEKD
ncbi:MAG: hypothetical protein UY76_C0069G0003 [Candidatus Uhrbacteria bacterium GW2011_GWA2_52_8d]|uniref:Glycosyltransferase 2-like domain-containing protein n=1 Tax=Candidatus Uhrbacteria bacterium GW2011_GWA2_52_8d TaxID=1618979 RepID=A0A0G2AER2_9BACT|nr:MAG: hypothetical protein UY76_C0069G0003 [Candidatus Uhrbacteria bacterium GW2011_GWA2_52_8d]